MMRKPEQGAAAIVIAMSMLMLLGIVALAIDGGLGFDDRRGSQNAADNAALAAAWENCNPEVAGAPDEETAALEIAADNGYAHDPAPSGYPDVEVDGSGAVWTVKITERNDGTFGQATPFAPDQLDIVSSATAHCFDQGVLGGYAIFGKAPSCPGSVDADASGADITIDGSVHANDDLKITGSSPTVSGEATYRGDDFTAKSINAVKYFGSPKPYPIDVKISEYEPTGVRALAAGLDYHNYSGSNIDSAALIDDGHATESGSVLTLTTAGIYYTDGMVDLNSKTLELGDDAATRGVTFVAKGQIQLGAGDLKGFDPLFTSAGPHMLLFSNYGTSDCGGKAAIKISGSDIVWEGVMFAPNGAIDASASGNSSVNGSIIGFKINLSGGEITMTYQNDPNAPPNFRVELIS